MSKEKSVSFALPPEDNTMDELDIIELNDANLDDLINEDAPLLVAEKNLDTVAISQENPLKFSILGDNVIALATFGSFGSNHNPLVRVDMCHDVDVAVAQTPEVTFVCLDLNLKEDGSLDDVELISILQKLDKLTQGGIILRTSVNIETMKRILSALRRETVENRFTYFPVAEDTDDPMVIMSSKIHLIGSYPRAYNNFIETLNRWSIVDVDEVIFCTNFLNVVSVKNMFSAYTAVRQTFFNQFMDYTKELGVVDSANLTRMWRKLEPHVDSSHCVPTFIRARTDSKVSIKKARSYGGEYRNKDIKLLVEETDKLTLLEECYNIRNIKD